MITVPSTFYMWTLMPIIFHNNAGWRIWSGGETEGTPRWGSWCWIRSDKVMHLLVWFFMFVLYLDLKKFLFLVVPYCSRLKEEDAMLMNSIHKQNDEIRKIADKVWRFLMLLIGVSVLLCFSCIFLWFAVIVFFLRAMNMLLKMKHVALHLNVYLRK